MMASVTMKNIVCNNQTKTIYGITVFVKEKKDVKLLLKKNKFVQEYTSHHEFNIIT